MKSDKPGKSGLYILTARLSLSTFTPVFSQHEMDILVMWDDKLKRAYRIGCGNPLKIDRDFIDGMWQPVQITDAEQPYPVDNVSILYDSYPQAKG